MAVSSGVWACGKPAPIAVQAACRHEHVHDEWLCSRHLADATRHALVCDHCEGHVCRVDVRVKLDQSRVV